MCSDSKIVLQLIFTDGASVDFNGAEGQFTSAKDLAKRWFPAWLLISAPDSKHGFLSALSLNSFRTHLAEIEFLCSQL